MMFEDVPYIGNAIKKTTDVLTLIKQLQDLKETVAVNQKAVVLQTVLLSLQQDLSAFQHRYSQLWDELEAAKARIRTLDDEKTQERNLRHEHERYHLHKLASGVRVYRLKETEQDYDPDMYFCPECMAKTGPSLLQVVPEKNMHTYLQCFRCREEFRNKRIPFELTRLDDDDEEFPRGCY